MEELDPKATLGHLSAAVGHQVINSFSTIVSQGEILRSLLGSSAIPEAEVKERIDKLIQTALDASLVTRRLIETSHEATAVGTESSSTPTEAIRLDELVAGYLVGKRLDLGPEIPVETDLVPVPIIRGQTPALHTMLGLLLDNAVEAMPGRRGTIRLSTRMDSWNWVVLEIRDDGCGMREEVLDHATEPFFTTKPGRKGIGLTVARSIWRRHRGTMTIQSLPGEGTSVRLSVAAPAPTLASTSASTLGGGSS